MSMLNREYKVLSKLKIDISKVQLEFHNHVFYQNTKSTVLRVTYINFIYCSVDIDISCFFISADLEEDNNTFQIYTHPDIVGSVQATIDSAHDQLIVGAR